MPPDGAGPASAPCDVVIAGAGNLGVIVYDCLIGDPRWRAIGFIDDTKPGTSFLGLPVFAARGYAAAPGSKAIMAVASPKMRRAFVQALAPLGLDWASFVDRRSHCSGLARCGPGLLALPFATIGPDTTIGQFGYVGAYAAVGTGAALGDYASLMARASAGACVVGECCQIGFNGACLDGASLGDGAVVAPYTWVRKPVPANMFVTGSPPRYKRLGH